MLKKQLADSAAVLSTESSYSLEKFTAGEEGVIYESSLNVPADDPEILQFVQSNPTVKIAGQAQWSLLKQFPQATDQNSLGFIASAVYQTVLGTNFVIVERHTGIMMPDYASPGLEAKAVPGEMDFKIFNPNETDYTLAFELADGKLNVSISGKPLLYTYEPVISEPDYYPFKQIIRYNPLLSVGEEKEVRSGAEGILVQTSRRVLDSQGFSLGIEEIAEDFYPPVHEILEKRYYVPIEAADPVINDLLNPETGLPENTVPVLPDETDPDNPDPVPPEAAEPPADSEQPAADSEQPAEEEPAAEAGNEQEQEAPEAEPAGEMDEEPVEK
nr:VanW family protein [Metabacillus mangrovi]